MLSRQRSKVEFNRAHNVLTDVFVHVEGNHELKRDQTFLVEFYEFLIHAQWGGPCVGYISIDFQLLVYLLVDLEQSDDLCRIYGHLSSS